MIGVMLNDLLRYRFISNVQYDPDGRYAAFVVACSNENQNYYDSCLWVWNEEENKIFQLTNGGKEQTYIWEDDSHILFAAYRQEMEENRQEMGWEFTPIYRICISGGEAVKAYELPVSVCGLKRIDERYLLVLGEIRVGEPDLYKAAYPDKKSAWNQRRREEEYEILDENPFWQNGRGYINKKRTAVFLYDKQKEELLRLSNDFLDTRSVTVKGMQIYYAGETYQSRSSRREEIWKYDIKSKEHSCVYHKEEYNIERLEAAGDHIVVFASDEQKYGINENPCMYELDEKQGKLRLLLRTDESIGSTVGSDCRFGFGREVEGMEDGSLYLIVTRRNASHLLHFIRGENGWQLLPMIVGEGTVDSFAVNPKTGKILLVGMYQGRLQELYQGDQNGEICQISFLNEQILKERYVARPEKLTVISEKTDIDGWVLRPKDFCENKKYPAVLEIHGGPKTVYGEVFFHEMQYLAGQNYFVFFCNPFGSDGRGNAFSDLRGKYGTVDYHNIMDFTDAVLRRYPQIDADRLAVLGGSYGGFMTNWIIGHTRRFACAISQRSISNWISFAGLSDIGSYFVKDQMKREIGEDIEKLWQYSPLCYIDQIETPTLFLHSDEDYRCPLEQGMQLYAALVEKGVPARMCIFKEENHEMSRSGKPKHRIRRLIEMTDWLKKWTGKAS